MKLNPLLYCLLLVFSFVDAVDPLSLEEKLGQLLMVHFNGEIANKEASCLLQDLHIGGIIYYKWANGLTSASQISNLSKQLQELAKTPLFIAVDQEGGRVARIQSIPRFPSNQVIGNTDAPFEAEKAAFITGTELKKLGINLNLAPVVDVSTHPESSVIGDRSFSPNPLKTSIFGKAALDGYHQAGLMACLKHYPGCGDVQLDPHEHLPVLNKSRDELNEVELLPFSQLARHADFIMTAHLLAPALDEHFCSTLSKKTLDILRHEMDFQGVIITDSLVMKGLLYNCPSIEEAAIQAFLAGCDVILLGGKLLQGAHNGAELDIHQIERVLGAFKKALETGRITEERLNQSIDRILQLKTKYLS